jgi:hypothetical protein
MYILSPVVIHRLINGLDDYVPPAVEYFQLNFHGIVNLRELIAAGNKYITASGI